MRTVNRRQLLAYSSALSAMTMLPARSFAQETMRTRPIPGSNETLPVIGLGADQIFIQTPEEDKNLPKSIIQAMTDMGGRVIDTPAFFGANELGQTFSGKPILGELITEMGLQEKLFLTGKITVKGKEEGIAHLEKTEQYANKRPMDLLLVHNMLEMNNHWPTLKAWKDSGRVRYIGASLTRQKTYEGLEKFMKEEKPDFILTGYSMAHPQAAERVLPLALDMGIAVIGAEPFKAVVDGAYFNVVAGKQLPKWASEFDCETWAQFSLKYILSNPAMTCVLTETSSLHHAKDNLMAGYGRLPDETTRQRMSEHFRSL
jgi:diketogulonate reductase-like aldo/keto reductase